MSKDIPVTVASILDQSNSSKAAFKAMGEAQGIYYNELVKAGISNKTAERMVVILAEQLFSGTFNKV